MQYFDHAATHPLCEAARTAWLAAAERFPANPSSPHRLGARADRAVEDARAQIATRLGCRTAELVFTSGASESNSLLVHHLSHSTSGEVLVSALEHPSVLEPFRRWLPHRHTLIPATPSGAVDRDWLEDRVRQRKPYAVVLMAANNETGVLQPWAEVNALCQRYGVPFGCDAAQWIGKLPAAGLGDCTWVSGCAHKFGGPLGVGFLKTPARLTPLQTGGPQESGRRAGTENVPGIVAMAAALEVREAAMAAGGIQARAAWRDQFIRDLLQQLPGTELVGAEAPRLWNTASLVLPPRPDHRRWVVVLDRQGFAVSSGSACSSGQEKPSHVLAAMGRSADQIARAVRFSSGWETTRETWDTLLAGVLAAATNQPAPPRSLPGDPTQTAP